MTERRIERDWQAHTQEVIQCELCPRLVQWRQQVARIKKKAYRTDEYWGKPVPGFGDENAKVMVVGLAPGAHGSNRTGRMFTGDASGNFLYPALFRAGFTNQPSAINLDDGLKLKGLFISALCRCAPPGNKPMKEEINNCHPFLISEIDFLNPMGFVALGRMAFENLLMIYSEIYGLNLKKRVNFQHGSFYKFDDHIPWLITSFHPSRQNTQTGRLTLFMFDQIWIKAKEMSG
jgi:uracil-DNA glycosylase family 4